MHVTNDKNKVPSLMIIAISNNDNNNNTEKMNIHWPLRTRFC